MDRGERPGVVERDAEIEDVGMRVEDVGARVDRFGSFKRNEFANLQIHPAFGKDRKVQVQIRLNDIGLE